METSFLAQSIKAAIHNMTGNGCMTSLQLSTRLEQAPDTHTMFSLAATQNSPPSKLARNLVQLCSVTLE
jgi:hypothetical protein